MRGESQTPTKSQDAAVWKEKLEKIMEHARGYSRLTIQQVLTMAKDCSESALLVHCLATSKTRTGSVMTAVLQDESSVMIAILFKTAEKHWSQIQPGHTYLIANIGYTAKNGDIKLIIKDTSKIVKEWAPEQDLFPELNGSLPHLDIGELGSGTPNLYGRVSSYKEKRELKPPYNWVREVIINDGTGDVVVSLFGAQAEKDPCTYSTISMWSASIKIPKTGMKGASSYHIWFDGRGIPERTATDFSKELTQTPPSLSADVSFTETDYKQTTLKEINELDPKAVPKEGLPIKLTAFVDEFPGVKVSTKCPVTKDCKGKPVKTTSGDYMCPDCCLKVRNKDFSIAKCIRVLFTCQLVSAGPTPDKATKQVTIWDSCLERFFADIGKDGLLQQIKEQEKEELAYRRLVFPLVDLQFDLQAVLKVNEVKDVVYKNVTIVRMDLVEDPDAQAAKPGEKRVASSSFVEKLRAKLPKLE